MVSLFFLPVGHSADSVPHLNLYLASPSHPWYSFCSHSHSPNPHLRQVQHSRFSSWPFLSLLSLFLLIWLIPIQISHLILAAQQHPSWILLLISKLPTTHGEAYFFSRPNHAWWELLLLDLFHLFLLRYFLIGSLDSSEVFILGPQLQHSSSPLGCHTITTSAKNCSQVHSLLLKK